MTSVPERASTRYRIGVKKRNAATAMGTFLGDTHETVSVPISQLPTEALHAQRDDQAQDHMHH